MYQAVGIDPAKKIVIYDQGGSWFAPRLFFQLRLPRLPGRKALHPRWRHGQVAGRRPARDEGRHAGAEARDASRSRA